jgi:hypothetical protein
LKYYVIQSGAFQNILYCDQNNQSNAVLLMSLQPVNRNDGCDVTWNGDTHQNRNHYGMTDFVMTERQSDNVPTAAKATVVATAESTTPASVWKTDGVGGYLKSRSG